jgi:stage V sporulation protein B
MFEAFVKIAVGAYLLGLFLPRGIDYACYALILGGLIAEILACIYAYVIYVWDKSRYKDKGKADEKLTKRMFDIALPVAFSSYIRSGLSSYRQIMIPAGLEKSGMSCAVSLAQYGVIGGMVMPILTFPSALLAAFGSLVIPDMAEYSVKNDTERINATISKIFKVTLLFSICSAGVLFSFSDELTALLYNNSDAAFLLKCFAPLVVIMYSDDIIDAILKGLGEQVYVVRVNIIDSIISIALLYVMLPLYGIKGYIIVFFISELFNAYLSVTRLIKVTRFRFKFVEWCIVPTIAVVLAVVLVRLLPLSNVIVSMTATVIIYLILLQTFLWRPQKTFK